MDILPNQHSQLVVVCSSARNFSLKNQSIFRIDTSKPNYKPFWFNSLGQMVQFDTINFGRTFRNNFGQFVGIEKKESL